MPRKTASTWRDTGVLVSVYVEIPQKRRFVPNNGQNNHQCCRHRRHLHHHLFSNEKPKQGGGYNRRAELLEYSRKLRESVTSHKNPVLQPQPVPLDSLQRSRSQPLISRRICFKTTAEKEVREIVPVQNKLRSAKVPTCFGTLTIRLPSFSRAKSNKKKTSRNGQSTTAKLISIVKNLRVQSKGGFFSKMFGSLRRKR